MRYPLRLSDRPIRTKLAVWAIVPLTGILALALVIGVGGGAAAVEASRALRLVQVGATAGELTAQLQRERALAAMVFAQSSRPAAVEAYVAQWGVTDAVVARFTAEQQGLTASGGLLEPLGRADALLDGLSLLREQVRGGRDTTGSLVVFRYRAVIADLGAYRRALGQAGVDVATAGGLRASATLSQAIEALGLVQVTVLPAIGAGPVSPAEQQQIVAASATFAEALEDFRQIAPPGWQTVLTAAPGDQATLAGERLQAVAARTRADTPLDLGAGVTGWVSATDARMRQLHAVEHRFDAELVAAVTAQRDAQVRRLALLGAGVAVLLAGLAGAGWRVSASITTPLQVLEAGATRMASVELPAMIRRIAAGASTGGSREDVTGQGVRGLTAARDEVGRVAVAFEQMAATAVDLAGQQARARAVVDEIVESVARRLNGQVDQLTAKISVLEDTEQDPGRLGELFVLDHRTSVLRTAIGSLLVIAGGHAGDDHHEPVVLVDLVRVAFGRIEHYEQVDTAIDPRIMIEAAAAGDLTQLLTELLANATTYAPAGSTAVVRAEVVGDVLHVQVADTGYGMTPDFLEAQRGRLQDFRLDAQTVRHLGFPVVGRIADQLGITVSLRSHPGDGTRVDLTLPAALFHRAADPILIRNYADARPTLPQPSDIRPAPITDAVPALPARTPDPAATAVLTLPPPAVLPAAVTQQLPYTGTSESARLTAIPAAAVIYEKLATENPWFADGPAPSLGATWQHGAEAVERAQKHIVQDDLPVTVSGLPKRRPQSFTIPQLADTPAVPRQRDPARSLSQLAAAAKAMSRTSPPPSRQIGPS